MAAHTIEFRWTVSRGRDTYGYNICTAWLDGSRVVGRCNGGGYDMKGTSFGIWLMTCYQKRLVALAEANKDNLPLHVDGGNYTNVGKVQNPRDFYGMSVYVKSETDLTVKRVHLDGGCGFDSIYRIAQAIGIRLEMVPTRQKDNSLYLVHDDKPDDGTDC